MSNMTRGGGAGRYRGRRRSKGVALFLAIGVSLFTSLLAVVALTVGTGLREFAAAGRVGTQALWTAQAALADAVIGLEGGAFNSLKAPAAGVPEEETKASDTFAFADPDGAGGESAPPGGAVVEVRRLPDSAGASPSYEVTVTASGQ